MLRDNFLKSSQRKLKLTAQEFTLHNVTQADQAKKKNTVPGVGHVRVRSDKHCRRN